MMMLFCIRSRGILTTKIQTEYYTNRFHKEYMRQDKTMFDACTVFNSWNTSSLFEVNDINVNWCVMGQLLHVFGER